MSPGVLDRLSRSRPDKWSFWRYNWLAHHKMIRAIERTRGSAHGTLLDVGCGTRMFAQLFEGRVERYLGVDLLDSPWPGATPDVYARAEALPLRAGGVDTVLGLAMLTYLPGPMEMLREAHRVLSRGGVLFLEFTRVLPSGDPMAHHHAFTRDDALAMLDRAGFDLIELVPIGGRGTRTGMRAIAALGRINRGRLRPLTELPVRFLYIVLQLGFELLDRVISRPGDALAHLAVARRREAPDARGTDTAG